MVAIDVGAHHGIQTIPMALWGGEGSMVYAFEANRENAHTLFANIGINRLSSCVGVYAALGAESGTIAMEGEAVGRGVVSSTDTPCWSLDDYCAAQTPGNVDFIKIDVEGFETNVLNGAKKVLATRPHISLELHIDDLKTYGSSASEALGLIDWNYYHVTCMNRAVSWFDTVSVTDWKSLPDSGIVNLFFKSVER